MLKNEDEQCEATFAQFEGKCWCCGKPGHKSPQCSEKNKPKKEWAMHKTKEMQHAQHMINGVDSDTIEERSVATTQSTTTSTANSSDRPFWVGGAGFFQVMQAMVQDEVSFLQFKDLKDMILLDSASSAHVFCNEKMLDKTWDAEQHLALTTNGGPFQTSKKG